MRCKLAWLCAGGRSPGAGRQSTACLAPAHTLFRHTNSPARSNSAAFGCLQAAVSLPGSRLTPQQIMHSWTILELQGGRTSTRKVSWLLVLAMRDWLFTQAAEYLQWQGAADLSAKSLTLTALYLHLSQVELTCRHAAQKCCSPQSLCQGWCLWCCMLSTARHSHGDPAQSHGRPPAACKAREAQLAAPAQLERLEAPHQRCHPRARLLPSAPSAACAGSMQPVRSLWCAVCD